MDFLKKIKLPALAGFLFVAALVSCEQDLTTIGAGVIGGEPFNSGQVAYEVFARNKKIKAVPSNKLPVYQLGMFNDPIYGKTEARITAQLRLSTPNPIFGARSQANEDLGKNSTNLTRIPENEVVDSVYLYIPFLTNALADTDQDGVADEFDADDADATNDDDNDGLTNAEEKSRGTDPLNPDTDGDDVDDDEDTEFTANQFPKKFDLDSIYGNRDEPFELKVQQSTYFLRDLDPNSNFSDAQSYFSSDTFMWNFVGANFLEDNVSAIPVEINSAQIPLQKRDDSATEDVDESEQFDFLSPGIRVALDKTFFQQQIIDKEGGSELLSQSNFSEYLRGVHLSLASNGHYLLLDLRQANIVISYTYDSVDTNNTATDGSDDEIVKRQSDYTLNFLTFNNSTGAITGNAVNTFINDEYPTEITAQLDTDQDAPEIYLKGGAGTYAEINLFDLVNGSEAINQIKANNWIINEANLVFHVNSSAPNAIEVILPPRLYLYNVETGLPLFDSNVDKPNQTNTLASYPLYGGLLDDSDPQDLKYVVRITNHINNMVVRDSTNATLGLTITPDIRSTLTLNAILAQLDSETGVNAERRLPGTASLTPLGTILYGNNVGEANLDKKLQLVISYTQAN